MIESNPFNFIQQKAFTYKNLGIDAKKFLIKRVLKPGLNAVKASGGCLGFFKGNSTVRI
jgi:hypothetical protein